MSFIVVKYWKPVAASSFASSIVVAVATSYWSSWKWTRCVCLTVFLMLLCPSSFWTKSMFFVHWKVFAAPQLRKVLEVMVLILSCLGLCPFTGAFIVMMLFERFIKCSRRTSSGSANVSFSICKKVSILLLLKPAISWLSSVPSGMNVSVSSCVYVQKHEAPLFGFK